LTFEMDESAFAEEPVDPTLKVDKYDEYEAQY
jgi:hypothetical protein